MNVKPESSWIMDITFYYPDPTDFNVSDTYRVRMNFSVEKNSIYFAGGLSWIYWLFENFNYGPLSEALVNCTSVET